MSEDKIVGEPEWRCFHCNKVFSDKTLAREHFGDHAGDIPACQLTDQKALQFLRDADTNNLVLYRQKRELEEQIKAAQSRIAALEAKLKLAADALEGVTLPSDAETFGPNTASGSSEWVAPQHLYPKAGEQTFPARIAYWFRSWEQCQKFNNAVRRAAKTLRELRGEEK